MIVFERGSTSGSIPREELDSEHRQTFHGMDKKDRAKAWRHD